MQLSVALFGITRDIVGRPVIEVEIGTDHTVAGLLAQLRTEYPALTALRSLAVAVNNEYAPLTDSLHERDEVALIPPVSGG